MVCSWKAGLRCVAFEGLVTALGVGKGKAHQEERDPLKQQRENWLQRGRRMGLSQWEPMAMVAPPVMVEKHRSASSIRAKISAPEDTTISPAPAQCSCASRGLCSDCQGSESSKPWAHWRRRQGRHGGGIARSIPFDNDCTSRVLCAHAIHYRAEVGGSMPTPSCRRE